LIDPDAVFSVAALGNETRWFNRRIGR